MSKISQLESSESSLIAFESEIELTRDDHELIEPSFLSGNEIAKRGIAAELLQQGLSEEAVCRILNISPNLLSEPLPS